MTEDNRRQPPRWGHGLHPVADHQWNQRRDDALELRAALENRYTPEWTEELDGALERMTNLFRDISRQSSRDWFVASSLMSHPSPRLSGRLALGLEKLREQLAKDDIDGINRALKHLEEAFLLQMVERYLNVTRPTNPVHSEPLVGWAYMISPASDPSVVLAGATTGGIHDVVSEANRANPGMAPFGVVAAWRATDPTLAGDILAEEIGDNYIENGYYFSGSAKDLRDMKQRADDALVARKLVIGNPMHVPGVPKPIMSRRPYSHDISNKKFRVDLDGVFEAFRR